MGHLTTSDIVFALLGVLSVMFLVLLVILLIVRARRNARLAALAQESDETNGAAQEPEVRDGRSKEAADEEGLEEDEPSKKPKVPNVFLPEDTGGETGKPVPLENFRPQMRKSATEELADLLQSLVTPGEISAKQREILYEQLLKAGFLSSQQIEKMQAEHTRLAALAGQGALPSGVAPGKQGLPTVPTHAQEGDQGSLPGSPGKGVRDFQETAIVRRRVELPEEESIPDATGGTATRLDYVTGEQPPAKPGEPLPTTPRLEMDDGGEGDEDEELIDLFPEEPPAIPEVAEGVALPNVDPPPAVDELPPDARFDPMTGKPLADQIDEDMLSMFAKLSIELDQQGVQLGADGVLRLPGGPEGDSDDPDFEALADAMGEDPDGDDAGWPAPVALEEVEPSEDGRKRTQLLAGAAAFHKNNNT